MTWRFLETSNRLLVSNPSCSMVLTTTVQFAGALAAHVNGPWIALAFDIQYSQLIPVLYSTVALPVDPISVEVSLNNQQRAPLLTEMSRPR